MGVFVWLRGCSRSLYYYLLVKMWEKQSNAILQVSKIKMLWRWRKKD